MITKTRRVIPKYVLTFSSFIVSLTVASRVLWILSCWDNLVMEDLK